MDQENERGRTSAVFILSNGRPDSVKTFATLRKAGYTGKIYIIIDDEDDRADEYCRNFGEDNILVYSKEVALSSYDTGMLQPPRKLGGCARSVCHYLAKQLSLTHFVIVDDDMFGISHKYFVNSHSREFRCSDFDAVLDVMFDFLDVSGAIAIGTAQGGDYIGGVYSKAVMDIGRAGWNRKCMNMLFCRTDRPLRVYGALNSDVTSYVVDGRLGHLYFTAFDLLSHYTLTSVATGGMTSTYEKYGTYVKSFMSVMYAPSCVRINVLNGGGLGGNRRIHHHINWCNCVPMIISDKYRKEGSGEICE